MAAYSPASLEFMMLFEFTSAIRFLVANAYLGDGKIDHGWLSARIRHVRCYAPCDRFKQQAFFFLLISSSGVIRR